VLYALNALIPSFYFNQGKAAYQHRDYKKAYSYFNTVLRLNRNDKDFRYYFVQTLVKLPPTLDVQKKLYEFAQENLSDSADLIADRQIAKWKQRIISNIGENYIEQVPYDNKILRWDASKFPLKVFIQNTSQTAPKYYKDEIENAFSQWTRSSAGFIRFSLVDNANDADIVVKVLSSADINKCSEENCKYVVAYTSPMVKGDLLKQMNITFYDSNNLAKPFSQREIYNTALHEIGHALGVMGHSYDKDDLMYMENNVDQTFDKSRSDFQLISPIDLNTLNLLYKLIPEITNTDLAKFDYSKQFFAPIIMGSGEQINSRKLLEAQNYIASAPNLPNGYIDLSAAYVEQHEYNNAIESLQKALERSTNDSEKVVVYYNFAVIYMDIQDWETSLKYANLAKSIQPSAEIDGLIAGINFNRGNKTFAKNSYIETLEKNPGSVIDSINLAKIYLKELNLVDAGKTLNTLVQANPDVKSDPRIKAYSILMFFFR
jgi:predicted Zn-dependent protease